MAYRPLIFTKHRRRIVVFLALGAGFLFLLQGTALAAETDVQFTPQITIPGSEFVAGQPVAVQGTTIGEWVSAVYVFLSGSMGIIAAMMVMWGGIKWLTAGGNTAKVGDAKETIYSALIALLLTLGAYILLNSINPQLVRIRDLTDLVDPIGRIEQLSEALLPKRVSEALFGNQPLTTEKNQFNAAGCPTNDEMRAGVEVFLTGYYRPAFPTQEALCQPSGGYANFPCNVGMQCWCTHGPACGMTQCQAGGLTWQPCDMDKFDKNNYCNDTAMKGETPPVGLIGGSPPLTAAASDCFGYGTTFTLSRQGGSGEAFEKEWGVSDRGKDIQGRHLDLFMGMGEQARSEAVNITGRATMKVTVLCDARGDCVEL